MKTTADLQDLFCKMERFMISHHEFANPKVERQVRELWDKNRMSNLHCEIRSLTRSILVSQSHVLNDVIFRCFVTEYKLLEYWCGMMKKLITSFKQYPELKEWMEDYSAVVDPKRIISLLVSDLKEAGEKVGVEPDIKELLSVKIVMNSTTGQPKVSV